MTDTPSKNQPSLWDYLPVAVPPPATTAFVATRPKRKTGHAAPVGTGPAGETCRSCAHMERLDRDTGRVYRKCGLMRRFWTNGPGSDIRAGDAACKRWEAKPN